MINREREREEESEDGENNDQNNKIPIQKVKSCLKRVKGIT